MGLPKAPRTRFIHVGIPRCHAVAVLYRDAAKYWWIGTWGLRLLRESKYKGSQSIPSLDTGDQSRCHPRRCTCRVTILVGYYPARLPSDSTLYSKIRVRLSQSEAQLLNLIGHNSDNSYFVSNDPARRRTSSHMPLKQANSSIELGPSFLVLSPRYTFLAKYFT
jgi:hypothetical protein